MNTFTNVVTFLMVFLIQAMQNRDSKAMHLKLDELLRAVKEARTSLVSLEKMTDDELDELAAEFQRFRAKLGKTPPRRLERRKQVGLHSGYRGDGSLFAPGSGHG